jgi:hypothetical protein
MSAPADAEGDAERTLACLGLGSDVASLLEGRAKTGEETERIDQAIETCLTRCDESMALANSIQADAGTTSRLISDQLLQNTQHLEDVFREIDALKIVMNRLTSCVNTVQGRSQAVQKAFDAANPSNVGRLFNVARSFKFLVRAQCAASRGGRDVGEAGKGVALGGV